MYNASAVTWWTRLVRAIYAACKNDSTVPAIVLSACTSASSKLLPYNQSPRVHRVAIFMCRPPNITTNFSITSGHFHWICFVVTYKGWSNVTTDDVNVVYGTQTLFIDVTHLKCRFAIKQLSSQCKTG